MLSKNCIIYDRQIYLFVCALLICVGLLSGVGASCPNLCSGHGECNKYSRCECTEGFQSADCSEKICPFGDAWSDVPYANDKAHQLAECSNRGVCSRRDGLCVCMEGFTGSSCDRLACPSNCMNNGKCMSMEKRALKTLDDFSNQYLYEDVWDANKIYGCICDERHSGYDCSLRVCPDGDDPLTTGQFNDVQYLKCIAQANSGSFVLYYKGVPSPAILASASAIDVQNALLQIPILTGVKVTFSRTQPTPPATVVTVCQPFTNVVKIEFTNQFGRQPPLVPKIDEDMVRLGGTATIAAAGAVGAGGATQDYFTDNAGVQYNAAGGTKEAEPCANRGICSEIDGLCQCYTSNGDVYASSDGYGKAGNRGDCGFIYSGLTVATCPGEIQCSGHGVCLSTKRCSCATGWIGGDCSERDCPYGKSWFDYPIATNNGHAHLTRCSDMGICDKSTGLCSCRSGFYGDSCDKMSCGGGVETPCNGHGRCMNMYELALWSEANGDATDITYGKDPNNPYTWDAHRLHACKCDKGFSGYDCSLKDCPMGDDPATYDQHVEVQAFRCIADTGTFKLTFRQETTDPIPFNAKRIDVLNAILKLPSVHDFVGVIVHKGNVEVFFTQDKLPSSKVLLIEEPEKTRSIDGMPIWGQFNANGQFVANNAVPPVGADGSLVCDLQGGQLVIIHFNTVHGDLPRITADVTDLSVGGDPGTGAIALFSDGQTAAGKDPLGATKYFTTVRGTTEVDVCNNRGLCDTEIGQCVCFTDWSSSDGEGGPGNRKDCGYRNQMKFSWHNSENNVVDIGDKNIQLPLVGATYGVSNNQAPLTLPK